MHQRDVGRTHRVSATALKVEPTSIPTLQMKRHVEFALQKEKRSPHGSQSGAGRQGFWERQGRGGCKFQLHWQPEKEDAGSVSRSPGLSTNNGSAGSSQKGFEAMRSVTSGYHQ